MTIHINLEALLIFFNLVGVGLLSSRLTIILREGTRRNTKDE